MHDPLLISLLLEVNKYIKKETDIALITKAFLVAQEKHSFQVRRSGEPYITHPVAVAKILTELEVGPLTIAAALLHDVIEDTDISYDYIEAEFGKDVASLVEGVTKIKKISFSENFESDNQQKMLLAMAKDIRVIIIKIADRLHNMRTLDSMPKESQLRIAKETLEIYSPLAHRLGIFRMKAELEDRSLRYTNPAMYYTISNMLQVTKDERETAIENIIEGINLLLKENKLTDFEIKGRIKNIYSIYKKMAINNKSFEDIYDLLAIRIIVNKIEECYQILGLIHASFTPIPRRFKDYIAVPKPNLYQSLHTTVLGTDETLFEVQIRTKEMDLVAEYGVAAHWAYKENKEYSKEKEQFEIAQKLKWYGELLKLSEDKDEKESDTKEFVDTIKGDILEANVYVFTPKGEVIELPKGATPIDFAYRIHTDLGHKMVGAIVNNRIVPLDYDLKTGDIVSVKTNKSSIGPSESWLKIAHSAHARHKIKAFLNLSNKSAITSSGKELLERELLNNKILEFPNDAFAKKHFEKNGVTSISMLLFEIGKGIISPKTVVNKILGLELDKEQILIRQMERTTRQLTTNSATGVMVSGLPNPRIKLSNCCNPIFGDDIKGYVSKTQGIVIHIASCPNLKTLDNKRLLPVSWAQNVTRKFPTAIKIISRNRPQVLTEIIATINSNGISIAEINALNTSQLESIIKLKISVNSVENLNSLFANLKRLPDVYAIERDIK